MSKRRERKAATYRVAAHLMAEEIYRAKGEMPVTVEQMDRDELLGITIPGCYRASRAPAHVQSIGHGWDPDAEGDGVDLTGSVLDGKGF